MRFLLTLPLFFLVTNLFSQEIPNFSAIDSLYREDQFYIGLTYNTLQSRPAGVFQNKFTPSFSFGFLRDMPINKSRTIAIAAGLGYSINNYNQNILITSANQVPQYNLIEPGSAFNKNKITLHFVEVPIEFRWRSSTPTSHVFWRIHTGFKMNYMVFNRSKYSGSLGDFKVVNNKDYTKFQYGVYLATGRNTWNFYIYYGLNPLFKSAELDDKAINMSTLNMGLIFYIL